MAIPLSYDRSTMKGAWIVCGIVFMAFACSRSEPPAVVSGGTVTEPPADYATGKALYDAHCAQCHGPGGAGTNHGPSFLSKIYEPGHHADASFVMAARRGVAAHHWGFGDMPPIPGVSDDDLARIIGYVRWVQRQAGIS